MQTSEEQYTFFMMVLAELLWN